MKNKLPILLFLFWGIVIQLQAQSLPPTPSFGGGDSPPSGELEGAFIGKQTNPLPKLDNTTISSKTAVITFEKGVGTYAFDEWLDYYKSVSLISEKNVYDRMANAENPESVIFSTPQGQQCDYSYDEKTKTYTITLVAGQENDVQEIYALHKRNAQHYLTLGRLNVITYKKQTPKVVVVNRATARNL
jgi:hypothetical protein